MVALARDTRGITALEYGIISAWLAFVIVAAFARLGTPLSSIFAGLGSSL